MRKLFSRIILLVTAGIAVYFFVFSASDWSGLYEVAVKGKGSSWSEAEGRTELIPQTGHAESIDSLKSSGDGKFLLSSSEDGRIIIWDTISRKEVRSISDKGRKYKDAVFSSDDKWIYTIDYDNVLSKWDIRTGQELISFKVQVEPQSDLIYILYLLRDDYNQIGFIQNSDALYTTGFRSIKIWDKDSGKVAVKMFSLRGHSETVRTVAFSDDRRFILSGGDGGELKLWDAEKGKLLCSLKGHSEEITSLAFSSDGKRAVSHDDKYNVIVWDLENYKKLYEIENKYASWAAFAEDGNSLILDGYDSISRFDPETGERIEFAEDRPVSYRSFSFIPGTNLLAAGDTFNTISIWDTETGGLTGRFGGHLEYVRDSVLSSDGKLLLVAHPFSLTLWDTENFRVVNTFEKEQVQLIEKAAIAPDGNTIAYSAFKEIFICDTGTGEIIKTITGFEGRLNFMRFTPDGKGLVTGGYDNEILLWDIASGNVKGAMEGAGEHIDSMDISPDGHYAVSSSRDDLVRLWDLGSLRNIYTYDESLTGYSFVRFSSDGTQFLYCDNSHDIYIFDVNESSPVKRIDMESGMAVADARFSPDGESVIAAIEYVFDGFSNRVSVIDIDSGSIVKEYQGHSDDIKAVMAGPERNLVFSAGDDGTVRVWNTATDQSLILLASERESEWLIVTEDGYWDSSRRGGDLVAVSSGLEAWGVDQFAAHNNRPDLIFSRFNPGRKDLIEHFNYLYKKRLKRMGIGPESEGIISSVPAVEILDNRQEGGYVDITFRMTTGPEGSELLYYNIFVNDVALFSGYGKTASGKENTVREKIELNNGLNKIEISCTDTSGTESFRVPLNISYNGEKNGDLYYIGFGVSDYRDNRLDLNYADKDALDLGNMFKSLKGKEYNAVYSYIFTDSDCTVDKISSAKKLLSGASVDDTVVLFVAGHGLHDFDPGNTYYFLTHEADIRNLSGTAASFEQLEDILAGITPRKKLFLIDTCESGEVDPDRNDSRIAMSGSRGVIPRSADNIRGIRIELIEEAKADDPETLVKQGNSVTEAEAPREYLYDKDRFIYNDLLRRTGAIVFSSCRGGELSYESAELRNGFFTEAIMKGIQDRKADSNADGAVSTDELQKFVTGSVAADTGARQNPTVDRDNIYQIITF